MQLVEDQSPRLSNPGRLPREKKDLGESEGLLGCPPVSCRSPPALRAPELCEPLALRLASSSVIDVGWERGRLRGPETPACPCPSCCPEPAPVLKTTCCASGSCKNASEKNATSEKTGVEAICL